MKATKANITRILTSGVGYLPKAGNGWADRVGWGYSHDCTQDTIIIEYHVSPADHRMGHETQLQRLQRIANTLKRRDITAVLAERNDSYWLVLVIGEMPAGYTAIETAEEQTA
jgi:hypothetical protein